MNEEIYKISIDWIIHRIIFDNAHERTETAQTIIKSLIIIGPITHVLEMYTKGIGKVFAASTDDILSEVAELFALRGSGFSWKTLWKRFFWLIPVFGFATYMAFHSEHYIELERYAMAGVVYGVSAVILSLCTAVQSIFLYLKSIKMLNMEKKIKIQGRWKQFVMAFKQDFTNPARLGLGIGSLSSPFVCMTIFSFFPYLTHNGWVLAILGSMESIVAAITIFATRKIYQTQFEHKLKKLIK